MKPATPLPWYSNKSVDLEEWLACITLSPLEAQHNPAYSDPDQVVAGFHENWKPDEADAAYIVHAANAYPKLVEALKKADAENRLSAGLALNVSDLLRELGESE